MYQIVYLTRDGRLKYGASSETGSPIRGAVPYSVVASWVETCGYGVSMYLAHSDEAPSREEIIARFYPEDAEEKAERERQWAELSAYYAKRDAEHDALLPPHLRSANFPR